MRKHPILLAFIVIMVAVVALGVVVYLVSSWTGKSPTIAGNQVGVVLIEGILADSRDVLEQIKYFEEAEKIKAVVVRINSPGGGVVPSEEIYQAVRELRKKKKVVASMGAVAASGGYLVACGAERIMANPGTITGSISALMHFANIEELLKKVGVKSQVVKSGKFKDMGSPLREMTTEEKELLQLVVDDIFDHFLDIIVKERKIPKEKLKEMADGRIFTGRQAKALGLVDELGGLDEAVKLAAQSAGLKEKPETIYAPKKKVTLWEFLLRESFSSVTSEILKKEPFQTGLYFIYEPGQMGKRPWQ
ncbi:MAG TPA: signal peptide peptidase SppA [Syntrophales bacterium]|nr:signal peptide peptidase SppA [Syntrophales bacterium]HOL59237.1 signal peptide peptidase SppA [Syntrophales bacterium]HPO35287.1 signal peptide peptidase SppA [Syntrophales bacterium]